MKAIIKTTDRLSPHRQGNWDARAAANFICGGMGSGLLLWTALATVHGGDLRILALIGLALVGLGLTCVWFEIGRPWRALNVFRHFSTSWMTREASVAPLLFAAGAATLLLGAPALFWLTGLVGLVFMYSQGRILQANKGIPAWRHPRCLRMIVATGLTEGAGLLSMAALLRNDLAHVGLPLAVMLLVRFVNWRAYVAALTHDGAPAGTLRAFAAIDGGFMWSGHVLPIVLGIAGGLLDMPLIVAVAGALAVGSGAWFKYTLVCGAAFTQGFAFPHLPARGRGTAGAGVKTGWGGAH